MRSGGLQMLRAVAATMCHQVRPTVLMAMALLLACGCSRPVIKAHLQPSKAKDQYIRIKRVADPQVSPCAYVVPSRRSPSMLTMFLSPRHLGDAIHRREALS